MTQKTHKKFTDDELEQFYRILKTGTKDVPVSSIQFGQFDAVARQMVNALRKKGKPICTTHGGYYLATCSEDLEGTMRYMKALKLGMEETLAALNITYNSMKMMEGEEIVK